MAAVDATEVWVDAVHATLPRGIKCPSCRSEALRIFAALFDRAGIDGPGTIALTRDAEGRYGLGVVMSGLDAPEARGVEWHRAVVPVEDDEEGGTDG